jgi:hypothetical protein
MVRRLSICVGAMALAGFLSLGATGVRALTMQECSAKYKAAQSAGALNGKTWNQFRKDECSSNAAPARAPTASATSPAANPSATAATPAPSNAVFPTAVAPKYAAESAGKGRMHTCLDQYNANKASNSNGGLKWIQKGGGYYSQCNKRLKG